MGEAESVADVHMSWVRSLHAERVSGGAGPLGTAGLIDEAAGRRAAAAMHSGAAVSLSRPLSSAGNPRNDNRPGYVLETYFTDGPIAMGGDHLELTCHGMANTHIDGLNHIGLDGTWYGGFSSSDPEAYSVVEFARQGLFTRGVYIDVPAVHGTEWVQPDRPVTGADIEAALAATGTDFQPGDALIVDMGRDRFEAAGVTLEWGGTHPGLGGDAARWIVEHGVSMVCWDFLDAVHPDEPPAPVHLLIWAIGLVLVDNCDHSRLRAALEPGRGTCGLAVAPLPIVGGTGNNVNPLALL
jgi:kynurenine formamidase